MVGGGEAGGAQGLPEGHVSGDGGGLRPLVGDAAADVVDGHRGVQFRGESLREEEEKIPLRKVRWETETLLFFSLSYTKGRGKWRKGILIDGKGRKGIKMTHALRGLKSL